MLTQSCFKVDRGCFPSNKSVLLPYHSYNANVPEYKLTGSFFDRSLVPNFH